MNKMNCLKRMSVRILTLGICFLVVVMAFGVSGTSGTEVSIPDEDYIIAKIIPFYKGDYIYVNYSVDVLGRGSANIQLLDEDSYKDFQEWVQSGIGIWVMGEHSKSDTKHFDDSVKLYEHGKYYLVIDNINYSRFGTITVFYNIDTHTHSPEEKTSSDGIPGFQFAFLIIAIASMILIKRRNNKNR